MEVSEDEEEKESEEEVEPEEEGEEEGDSIEFCIPEAEKDGSGGSDRALNGRTEERVVEERDVVGMKRACCCANASDIALAVTGAAALAACAARSSCKL